VITDDCSGYRWLYGLKTKDNLLKAVQKWYSDIAELLELHNVCVVTRDNAGENKSSEVIEFFESKGIKSYFSTPYEQWQNGQGESSSNSLMAQHNHSW
jgi:IS30 family transposase